MDTPENWALVKPTLTATEYVVVRVLRKGKRFSFVEPGEEGVEWRYTTRGLWDGFASKAAAYAELDVLRGIARAHFDALKRKGDAA